MPPSTNLPTVCTTDAACAQSTTLGAGFLCYTIAYRKGVSVTAPTTGTATTTAAYCFPSDFASAYSTTPIVFAASTTATTGDSWLFTRVVTTAGATAATSWGTACTASKDCTGAANSDGAV